MVGSEWEAVVCFFGAGWRRMSRGGGGGGSGGGMKRGSVGKERTPEVAVVEGAAW